ncbi:MAG: hypothetical protein BGO67_06065 [Alphaproteobacteria bacterium 41-28]|nr:MAG: hypothetical protein BGO67_06065 [Alphaproteobacteria bacterium 41-28]
MLHSKKITLTAFCAAFLATSAVLAMEEREDTKGSFPGKALTREELSQMADEALDDLEEGNTSSSAPRQPQQDIPELVEALTAFLNKLPGKIEHSLKHREEEAKNKIIYNKSLKNRQRRAKYGVICLSDNEEIRKLEEEGYKWAFDARLGMNRLYKKNTQGNYYSVLSKEPMNVPIGN